VPSTEEPLINDDRRVYSDREFALILRKAAELAQPAEIHGHSPEGLTLAEMKAAAAEVGFDPALVERAARLLATNTPASVFERVIGGQVRLSSKGHFSVVLDDARAAQLLSAVQIRLGSPGTGHSSALGMTWHTSTDVESLSVTAQPDSDGTEVAVHLDRRSGLVVTGSMTLVGCFLSLAVGVGVGNAVAAALGPVAAVAGVASALALARNYWTSSTRKARERIGHVVDAVGGFLAPSGGFSSATNTADGSVAVPESAPGDAS
jgi:hypothetical protein